MLVQQALTRSSRIEVIDVLRGFTLLGIIIVHMVEQFYAGVLPEKYAENSSNIADGIVQGFTGIFIMGKFFMIFSFLFGLSFYIQLSKTKGDGSFLIRFAWRLTTLFIIGMVHHLHYRGDILTIYALLGFGLLIFYRLPDRYLLILSLLLVLNVPSLVVRLVQVFQGGDGNPFPPFDQDILLMQFETFKSGSYVEILKLNFYEFTSKMQFQVLSGRIYITLGLFLLGLYVGRKKIFEELINRLSLIKKLFKVSLWTLLAAVAFALVFFGGPSLTGITVPQALQWAVGGLLYDLANTCLAAFYVTSIILLFQKEKWHKRLMNFYEVGRMGLTTYLMQAFFGVMIFFGCGLGLLTELGAAICFAQAIVIFIFQIVFAKLWFQYFEHGFFEWLWRCLTYFKMQPLWKKRVMAAAVVDERN